MAQTKIDGSKTIIFDPAQYEGVKKYLGDYIPRPERKSYYLLIWQGRLLVNAAIPPR